MSSAPALRIAAGAVAVIGGIADLVRRPPAPTPALPGRRAALVPVAVPLVVRPALVVIALSAGADVGAWLVGGATLAAAVLLSALAVDHEARGHPVEGGRRLRIAAALVGAVRSRPAWSSASTAATPSERRPAARSAPAGQ